MKNSEMKPYLNNDAREELTELSPLLSRIRQLEQPVEAPEHYFRNMQREVLQQIKMEPQTVPAHRPGRRALLWPVFRRPMAVAGMAAAMMAIAIGLWWWLPSNAPAENQPLASLTEEEAIAYIENNIESFDTDLLAQVVTENASWLDVSGMSEEESEQLINEMIQELNADSLDELF